MTELEQDTEPVFVKPVVASTVVVLSVITLSVGVVFASLAYLRGHVGADAGRAGAWRHVPSQVSSIELHLFGREQNVLGDSAQLEHYGWVDRERGLVHLPIDVAMELYLQEAQRSP